MYLYECKKKTPIGDENMVLIMYKGSNFIIECKKKTPIGDENKK